MFPGFSQLVVEYLPLYDSIKLFRKDKKFMNRLWNSIPIISILKAAIRIEDITIIKKCLRFNEIDVDKALRYAAIRGNYKLCKYFIREGASDFSSALIESAYFNHLELSKYFLLMGGESVIPFMQSVIRGNQSMAALLFDRRFYQIALNNAPNKEMRDFLNKL